MVVQIIQHTVVREMKHAFEIEEEGRYKVHKKLKHVLHAPVQSLPVLATTL